MPDLIHIEQLELSALIGVTQEERAEPQRLTVSVTMEPLREFSTLGDDLANTVDYLTVCQDLKALATNRPRQLLETLGEEIAQFILEEYSVRSVEVELRKYILTDTAHVAVRLCRTA